MKYINKSLSIEKVKIQNLARRFGTPLYCYSYEKLKENIANFKKNFRSFSPLICFAVKSNTNIALIREVKKLGLGADVVSMGELMIALKAGIKPKKIVFSGVGKTPTEIGYAIDKKILLINAESKSEIIQIDKIARSKKKIVDIGLRLNPNIDAKTLKQISTGKKGNKFGVDEKTFFEIVKYVKLSKNINLKCLSVHLGSQILNHKPYEKMLKVVDKIVKKSNHNFEFIDLGGGMGISYEKNIKKLNYQKYSVAIKKFLKKYASKIIFEPGRSIIGNTGSLVSKVIYIKENSKKDFIILDAAMNDLMRPALYGANHRIIPAIKTNKISKKIYEFVGPICESTDKFINKKDFAKVIENDYVAIKNVGAYGMSLASNYNTRPLIAEILVSGSKYKLIKKKQSLENLINN